MSDTILLVIKNVRILIDEIVFETFEIIWLGTHLTIGVVTKTILKHSSVFNKIS